MLRQKLSQLNILKKISVALMLLIIIIGEASARYDNPREYNAPKTKLTLNRQTNIAEIVLDLEKTNGFEVTDYDYELLGKIIDKAIEKISSTVGIKEGNYTTIEAVIILETINNVLRKIIIKEDRSPLEKFFDKRGFELDGSSKLLSQGFRSERLSAKNASIIYFAIAEIIGLPLFLSIEPYGNFFLRYDPSNSYDPTLPDNASVNAYAFNYAPTEGAVKSIRYYTSIKDIQPDLIEKGQILRSLGYEETLALAYTEIGAAIFEQNYTCNRDSLENALSLFRSAAFIFPEYFEANLMLARMYKEKGNCNFGTDDDYDAALENYFKALELRPSKIRILFDIGEIYYRKNEYENAKKYLEEYLVDATVTLEAERILRSIAYEEIRKQERED